MVFPSLRQKYRHEWILLFRTWKFQSCCHHRYFSDLPGLFSHLQWHRARIFDWWDSLVLRKCTIICLRSGRERVYEICLWFHIVCCCLHLWAALASVKLVIVIEYQHLFRFPFLQCRRDFLYTRVFVQNYSVSIHQAWKWACFNWMLECLQITFLEYIKEEGLSNTDQHFVLASGRISCAWQCVSSTNFFENNQRCNEWCDSGVPFFPSSLKEYHFDLTHE